ncbi:MAG: UDP-N-acetylmuramate-alanine ligase [Bacteroidota bacterium]|jgi:UDP-N-acetylmuramate: L-alanyl-gamma-D-glutamyl-meso-diaminopimelate ligase|nr:UDP-N-acetylmuramate-alanine ligase [Bacteroidota bacterium]
MNIHLIAIGGSAMHNMALAMHKKGYKVSGSDDEIFEPSKSRLEKAGLLPAKEGWDVNNIHDGLDAIILGMHARSDNPELLRAQELGLKIYSYPEYIYEQTKDKVRVVVGGSHGKTTITAMILHVLEHCKINCDYMVGAQLAGFDTMVKLSQEAKIAVIEGDEYLSSPIDRRPKFHLYKPDIAILSGIAWDHINVFPTFDNYIEQFRIFTGLIEPNGTIVYCELDPEVKNVCEAVRPDIKKFPYGIPAHKIENGTTILTETGLPDAACALEIFGDHNLMNMNGARLVCNQLGVSDGQFYDAIKSFKGASKRLELVSRNESTAVYKDFAHSPSKLKATTLAVKKQFPDRKLLACMELHTFSSLNENFLREYKGSMAVADEAIVYFNSHTIEHKKLKPITEDQVKQAFGGDNIKVFTDSAALLKHLEGVDYRNKNLLLMSSGNFDGIDFKQLGDKVISS